MAEETPQVVADSIEFGHVLELSDRPVRIVHGRSGDLAGKDRPMDAEQGARIHGP